MKVTFLKTLFIVNLLFLFNQAWADTGYYFTLTNNYSSAATITVLNSNGMLDTFAPTTIAAGTSTTVYMQAGDHQDSSSGSGDVSFSLSLADNPSSTTTMYFGWVLNTNNVSFPTSYDSLGGVASQETWNGVTYDGFALGFNTQQNEVNVTLPSINFNQNNGYYGSGYATLVINGYNSQATNQKQQASIKPRHYPISQTAILPW